MRFVTDRQTDGQKDGQTKARGITICLPLNKRERHNKQNKLELKTTTQIK